MFGQKNTIFHYVAVLFHYFQRNFLLSACDSQLTKYNIRNALININKYTVFPCIVALLSFKRKRESSNVQVSLVLLMRS